MLKKHLFIKVTHYYKNNLHKIDINGGVLKKIVMLNFMSTRVKL